MSYFQCFHSFEQFCRNLHTHLGAFVVVLGAGAGSLQVGRADVQGVKHPFLGLSFGTPMPSQSCITRILRLEALKPSPLVLNPGVHQNHPEPFIKQPTPSSPSPPRQSVPLDEPASLRAVRLPGDSGPVRTPAAHLLLTTIFSFFFASQSRFSDYEKRKVRRCLLSSVTFLLIKHLFCYI